MKSESSSGKIFRDYLLITLGVLSYSFGWTCILTPAGIMGGGGGGISALVYYLTGGENGGFPIGITYLLLNAVLLAFGVFLLGPRFGTKSIYAIFLISLGMWAMQRFIPSGLVGLQDDKLLSAILGGGMAGLGIGLCFSRGGSSGGTDIIAMIVNKYRHISYGRVLILCDVVIIGLSLFVFRSVNTLIYGYVVITVTGYTVDLVVAGNRQSSQVFIISDKYAEIADRINLELGRGATLLDGTGWYTREPWKVLLVVCRKYETPAVYRIIRDADPRAFITAGSVTGVYGEGFDPLRVK